jgi:cell division protein FtsQ
MHQKIDKKNKIYIYLFIFFLLSTFNNIQIINLSFLKFNIDQIEVSGLSEKNNLEISQEIKKKLIENIFLIKKEFLLKILEKNNLINSFEIKKIYPNTIEVKIKKTEFLGITNVDGNLFFIGSNGKLIHYNESVKNLPYVFGKINFNDFIKFVKFVKKSKFDFNKIKEIYFFPSGRWDIKTLDDKLFKLPMENVEFKLNLIYELYKNEQFKNEKVIDLRFKKKIISTNE